MSKVNKYSTPLLWQAKKSSGVKMCLTSHIISCMDLLLCNNSVLHDFLLNTSSLYPTYTISCKVPLLSREFQTQILPQRPRRLSNASQPIGKWVQKNTSEIDNPFEHVINYTLGAVSLHPVTTKIQTSFLTQLPERKETAQGFPHEANGDFKAVTQFNGCDRRKLRNYIVVTPQY